VGLAPTRISQNRTVFICSNTSTLVKVGLLKIIEKTTGIHSLSKVVQAEAL